MAQKRLVLPEIGEVILQKRKGTRNVRISVSHDGTLRVSLPAWSPYKVGEAFVLSKTAWIKKHLAAKPKRVLLQSDRIGKSHRLSFIHERRPDISSRISKTEIVIKLPFSKEADDVAVQKVVQRAAIRALKQEAKNLLPSRLRELAAKHGFSYHSVAIKQLKTRWGSCSSNQDIALNCFLMQLPWDLIDYVILHELLHTQIMAHGKPFWDELGHYVPNLPAKRKLIRAHQPALLAQDTISIS